MPTFSLYFSIIESLSRVSFEAGGNAPFIVFDDADIDAAVDGPYYLFGVFWPLTLYLFRCTSQ